MALALLGLGSNVGDRAATLAEAVARLGALPQTKLLVCSRWHATRPIGGPAGQGEFLNGAALVETTLEPMALFAHLQAIEQSLGRQRREHWAARTLDLDVLLFDSLELDDPQLAIPHPAMAFRRFVLEPAAEVAPQMVHPGTSWTVSELLQHLNTAAPYLAIGGPVGGGQSQLADALATADRAIIHDPVADSAATAAADSPSPDLSEGLKFEQRAAVVTAAMNLGKSLTISDFWLPQGFLEAQAAGNQVDAAVFESVLPPKLLVVLGAASDPPRQNSPTLPSDPDDELDKAHEQRLWQQAFAARPPRLRGPVLFPQRGAAEVEAAIEAMR
jgi:2-amino-4-hydroxy-6-hydroxymethyldihydropteridine diphosphokinase